MLPCPTVRFLAGRHCGIDSFAPILDKSKIHRSIYSSMDIITPPDSASGFSALGVSFTSSAIDL